MVPAQGVGSSSSEVPYHPHNVSDYLHTLALLTMASNQCQKVTERQQHQISSQVIVVLGAYIAHTALTHTTPQHTCRSYTHHSNFTCTTCTHHSKHTGKFLPLHTHTRARACTPHARAHTHTHTTRLLSLPNYTNPSFAVRDHTDTSTLQVTRCA